jgi:hypothetical protein
MPLRKSASKAATRKNFEEFGAGRTYAATKKKSGKRKADKQRIAVVLQNKRKSAAKGKKRKSSRSKGRS